MITPDMGKRLRELFCLSGSNPSRKQFAAAMGKLGLGWGEGRRVGGGRSPEITSSSQQGKRGMVVNLVLLF